MFCRPKSESVSNDYERLVHLISNIKGQPWLSDGIDWMI